MLKTDLKKVFSRCQLDKITNWTKIFNCEDWELPKIGIESIKSEGDKLITIWKIILILDEVQQNAKYVVGRHMLMFSGWLEL